MRDLKSRDKSLGARAASLKYIVGTKIQYQLSAINADGKLKMQSKTKSEKFFSTATQSLTIEEELALLMRDHSPQALLNEYYNKKKKN